MGRSTVNSQGKRPRADVITLEVDAVYVIECDRARLCAQSPIVLSMCEETLHESETSVTVPADVCKCPVAAREFARCVEGGRAYTPLSQGQIIAFLSLAHYLECDFSDGAVTDWVVHYQRCYQDHLNTLRRMYMSKEEDGVAVDLVPSHVMDYPDFDYRDAVAGLTQIKWHPAEHVATAGLDNLLPGALQIYFQGIFDLETASWTGDLDTLCNDDCDRIRYSAAVYITQLVCAKHESQRFQWAWELCWNLSLIHSGAREHVVVCTYVLAAHTLSIILKNHPSTVSGVRRTVGVDVQACLETMDLHDAYTISQYIVQYCEYFKDFLYALRVKKEDKRADLARGFRLLFELENWQDLVSNMAWPGLRKIIAFMKVN